MFTIVAAHIYSPTNNVEVGGFFFAHPLMAVILKSFPANSNIWIVDGFISTALIF